MSASKFIKISVEGGELEVEQNEVSNQELIQILEHVLKNMKEKFASCPSPLHS